MLDRAALALVAGRRQPALPRWRSFGGHSLRSGFVTEASRQGVAVPAIMAMTEHQAASSVRTGVVSLTVGEEWLAGANSALLLVPSTIVPEEFNVLINPVHPDAVGLVYTKVRKFLYDPRLRACLPPPRRR